jgi:hypothetical protein
VFQRHKITTTIGTVGAVLALGHVVLGRAVVPPVVAIAGFVLVVGAGLFLLIAQGSADRAARGSDIARDRP